MKRQDRRRRGPVNRLRRWAYGIMLGVTAHGAHAAEPVAFGPVRAQLRASPALPLSPSASDDFDGSAIYRDALPRAPARLMAEPGVLFANPMTEALVLVAQGGGWTFGSALHFGPGAELEAEPVFLAPFDGVFDLPFDAELVLHYGRWRGDSRNAPHERLPQATLSWRF